LLGTGHIIEVPFFLGKNGVEIFTFAYPHRKTALVVGCSLVAGLGFFNGDVAKLSRIKYLSTGLALNELCVVLAGDDFDDGMFALWGHEWRERMVWILPVPERLVKASSCDFPQIFDDLDVIIRVVNLVARESLRTYTI
jgi:hypothetical protein